VETRVVSTDATVLSASMFRDKPVFGRPGEPARPFVAHVGAVCGFVFGIAAGSLSEVS
jgi:hypothetical protein